MTETRILIVDDHEDVGQAMKFGLRHINSQFDITLANDGFEALELLRRAPFDLIITDYMMPDMDGLELVESIRALSPGTQIIVTSAVQRDMIKHLLAQSAVEYFLQKPFTKRDLSTVIHEALSNKPVFPATRNPTKPAPVQDITDLLHELCRYTNAYSCFVVESAGYLLAAHGGDDQIHLPTLASLVAANAVATLEISQMLGNPESFQATIHEGRDYNMAAYSLDHNRIFVVVFNKRIKIGLVQHYARQTVAALLTVLPPPDTTLNETMFLGQEMDASIDASVDELFTLA